MEAPLIRRAESHFAGGGGRTLFRRSWLAAEPERAIVLVHGYAEHSGRYEHVGGWLASRGCAVHGYDHQGHGRSDGARGHAASLEALVDDLERLVERVRGEHAGIPLFVVGHSMGGLVALAYAVTRDPQLTGLVSSAAALGVAEPPSLLARVGLRVMRLLAPRLSMPRPVADTALSRDPEVGRAYRADPLVFQTMTLSLAAAIYFGGVRTLASAGDVALPVLLLHGGDDPLIPSSSSRRFADTVTAPGSELRIYPELRHEILNEPEWESVLGDLFAWLGQSERGSEGMR
ncbi:MAG: lysophospholipase [Deltaproteobacteria bacterium]|nr:lysophospholipase [Deltaproteobacteria bacterium]MBW2360238.1 lysophospholipase [Deltaproteobacteria bacterium]